MGRQPGGAGVGRGSRESPAGARPAHCVHLATNTTTTTHRLLTCPSAPRGAPLQAMSAAQEGPVDDPEAELVQAMAMNRRLRELEAKMDAGRAGRKSSTGGGAAGGSKAGARAPSKKTAAASGAAGGAGGGSMRRVQRGTLTPASTAAAAAPPPRPRREDASHTNEELYRIRRSNLVLLRHLEEIQRKGTGSAAGGGAFAKKPVNHTAPSSINRRKELTKIADQNVVGGSVLGSVQVQSRHLL